MFGVGVGGSYSIGGRSAVLCCSASRSKLFLEDDGLIAERACALASLSALSP